MKDLTLSEKLGRSSMTTEETSEVFREVREHIGLNKSQMARLCRVHLNNWNQWESGLRKPDMAAIRLIELIYCLFKHDLLAVCNLSYSSDSDLK